MEKEKKVSSNSDWSLTFVLSTLISSNVLNNPSSSEEDKQSCLSFLKIMKKEDENRKKKMKST